MKRTAIPLDHIGQFFHIPASLDPASPEFHSNAASQEAVSL